MKSLKEQGTTAFVWDLLGKIATNGVGFVLTIFLARLLEPSDFGLIALIMVFIGIASVFTDMGLGAALIQRRKVHSSHYSSVFYFNVFIASCMTLITYLSATWVSDFYQNRQLIEIVQAMSFLYILNAFSSVQATRLRKELNYKALTKISFISSLVSGSIGVYLAFRGAGVWSLVTQALTMAVVYNVLIWRGNWRPGLTFSLKALTQLWGFGFRMFISTMLGAIFRRIDFIIIGKLFPMEMLGFYQRAKSLSGVVVQYSSGSLMAILFPVLSTIQKDLPRFQTVILKSLGVICFVVFLLLGGLYLVSEELIVLLFSDKWLPSVSFYKILVLSGFSYPISALLINVLSSRGNSKAFLRLAIYKKVVLSVNFLMLYSYGINVFLYGLIIQAILGLSLNVFFAARELNLSCYLFIKPILVQMVISVVTVLITMTIVNDLNYIDIIMLLIKGGLFMLLYSLLNHLIKTTSYGYFLEQLMPILCNKFQYRL